jgi:hypothetical protein
LELVARDMVEIMVSEHSMNNTILASSGDPVGLTVSIAPWPHAGPPDYTATHGIESRIESGTGTLIMWIGREVTQHTALAGLRRLMQAALPLVREIENGKVTLSHAPLTLDAAALAEALDEWTDDAVPVHSLVAFDFALRGDPPGMESMGLAALVGQEIVAWPPDESLRLMCARMVVRLAHDMLLHGPILADTTYPAPDAPSGKVTLVPRDVLTGVVQIRF